MLNINLNRTIMTFIEIPIFQHNKKTEKDMANNMPWAYEECDIHHAIINPINITAMYPFISDNDFYTTIEIDGMPFMCSLDYHAAKKLLAQCITIVNYPESE